MTRLLLLAYDQETEHRRALLAVLSCWAWQPRQPLAATIYTDQPEFFKPYLAGLPISYKLLTPSYLSEARGQQQYVHRVKVRLVAEAFAEHPHDELLFVDSDTFFRASPNGLLQHLAAGQPFMHLREYKLAEAGAIYAEFNQARYPRKLLDLLASRSFELGGWQVRFHPEQSSWNSGVLGLPRTLAPLLPDILALNDALYAGTGWFVSEQLAFSLALQASGPVQACDQVIYHYWGKAQKVLMNSMLASYFTTAFAALPLAERLSQVRQQVPRFERQLAVDKAQEGTFYALRRGRLTDGLKCVTKALLLRPFDAQFIRGVARVLHRQTRLRRARQLARP